MGCSTARKTTENTYPKHCDVKFAPLFFYCKLLNCSDSFVRILFLTGIFFSLSKSFIFN